MIQKMLYYPFKLLLTIDSVIMLPIVFCVKCGIRIIPSSIWCSLILCFFVPIVLTVIVLRICNRLPQDSMEQGSILQIEQADTECLPVYLGYFFVALSIPDGQIVALCFVIFILVVFLFMSQNAYYNPWFLVFGYRFYCCTIQSGLKVLVITRAKPIDAKKASFNNLRRINDNVFIDL